MQAPFEVLSTDHSIQVGWQGIEGVQAGNSAILTYNLYWDRGTGETNFELVDALVSDFRVTGLVGGLNYRFKVRASNIYGYGAFSTEYSLEASDLPGRPEIPTVSLDGTKVLIEWQSPNNHFSQITQYQILFKSATGAFVENLTHCDGSILMASCRVPMLEIASFTGLTTD